MYCLRLHVTMAMVVVKYMVMHTTVNNLLWCLWFSAEAICVVAMVTAVVVNVRRLAAYRIFPRSFSHTSLRLRPRLVLKTTLGISRTAMPPVRTTHRKHCMDDVSPFVETGREGMVRSTERAGHTRASTTTI